MKKLTTILSTVLCLSLLVGVVVAAASEGTSDNSAQIFRMKDKGADKPTGAIRLKMLEGALGKSPELPSESESMPPVEPGEPGEEDEGDPASFFDEPIAGKSVFVLDVSLSMKKTDGESSEDYDGNTVTNASRLNIVKFETVKLLNSLGNADEFDFVLLAGGTQAQPITDAWQGKLVPCDDATRSSAIEYIKGLSTWWGTPTYVALERACHDYGDELDNMAFLSDGTPFPFQWNGGDHQGLIFQDFPAWFAPLKSKGCQLLCINIGQNPNSKGFMAKFAASTGAAFIDLS